jgi:hypothetical protein
MLKPTKYSVMAVTGVIEKEDKSVERSQFLELTKTGSGERVKEHYRSIKILQTQIDTHDELIFHAPY